MNEQFRIAQKLGLMFRADTPLPEDLKGWAISQLHSKSPALGFKMVSRGTNTPIEEWPRKLQPNLNERVQMWRTFWINEDLARAKKDGQDSASKRNENRKNVKIFNPKILLLNKDSLLKLSNIEHVLSPHFCGTNDNKNEPIKTL